MTSTGKRGRTNRTRKFSTSAHRKRKRVWLGGKSESGFSIGSENYETESTATSSETSPEEDIKDKPGTAQEKLERLKAEAEEQMEETTPYLSDARTSEEMYKAMISKGRLDNRPEIKWNPIQDRL